MDNEPAKSCDDEVGYCSLFPPGEFEKHMKIKIEGKPFKCYCCTSSCMEKKGLNDHIMNHATKKRYYCEFWSYHSSQKGLSKDYLRTNTPKKHFQCQKSSPCFTQSYYLKKHTRIHNVEKLSPMNWVITVLY